MLQTGKNITHADDTLYNVSIEYLVNALRNPREEIKTQIRQLRMLQTLDQKKYAILKKQLPYIVCSIFKPAFRRKTNFAHVSYFILDLDHLSDKGIILNNLKETIITDKRVLVAFESPGGDGLKIMFRLREKCYDEVKYSMFYKIFAKEFAEQYKIQQVIDTVTSDVTRACFISHDPSTYYNPDNEEIDIQSYINFEDLYTVKQIELELKNDDAQQKTETNKPEVKVSTVSKDLLIEIKQKLNPSIRTKPQKEIYVPDAIEDILPVITNLFDEYNIKIVNFTNISYGKKINFEFANKKAEINLFYGKKGYSVVITPKNGTDKELNELCHKILCEFFYGVD